MVGEATRTPIIQDQIKKAFQRDSLSRTLNSNECVALGCSIQSAYMCGKYGFKEGGYQLLEYNDAYTEIEYKLSNPN